MQKSITNQQKLSLKEVFVFLEGILSLRKCKVFLFSNKKNYFIKDNLHYLELLSTEFVKAIPDAIDHSNIEFISRIVYNFELLNIKSFGLSKNIINFLKTNQKKTPDFGGLLEGPKELSFSQPLILEKDRRISRKELQNVLSNRPEKTEISWVSMNIRTLWAYLKQNYINGFLDKKIDYELVTILIKKINSSLEKLENFSGLVVIEEELLEAFYQCSFFLEKFHKDNLISAKISLEKFEKLRIFPKKNNIIRMY